MIYFVFRIFGIMDEKHKPLTVILREEIAKQAIRQANIKPVEIKNIEDVVKYCDEFNGKYKNSRRFETLNFTNRIKLIK